MNSFNWRRNTEDSKKYGLIITVTTIRIFFVLKTRNVKPLKASLNTMDIMKLIGGIRRGVLVKDYTVYKRWIKKKKKMNGIKNNTKIVWLLEAIKLAFF